MNYQLRYLDGNGTPLAIGRAYYRIDWAVRINAVGALELDLPADFPTRYLPIDGRIELSRRVGGVYRLVADTQFVTRAVGYGKDENGREYLRVAGETLSGLLARRVCGYGNTTSGEVTDYADDYLKGLVRDNLGENAAAGRGVSLLQTAADVSAASSVTHVADEKNLLRVMTDIVEQLAKGGEHLFFDLVPLPENPARFEFRTYTGARGVDHSIDSPLPVVISNWKTPLLIEDHSRAASVVYASGPGAPSSANLQVETNDALSGISPYGRIEKLVSAGVPSTATGKDALVAAAAKAELHRSRPRKVFSGQAEDIPGFLEYGIQYRFGDIVTVRFGNTVMDGHVTAVHGVASESEDRLEVRVEGEEWL